MTDPEPSFEPHLREEAEYRVRSGSSIQLWTGWQDEDLIYELQIYHAELIAQHEELQLTVAELEREHQLYDTLYQYVPTAYFTLDEQATLLNVNQAGERLLGFQRGHLLARQFLQFIAPGQRAAFRRLLTTLSAPGATEGQPFTVLRRGDEPLNVHLQVLTLPQPLEHQATYLLTLVNMTPLIEAREALHVLNLTLEERVREATQHLHVLTAQFRHQARHDALTGLPNRAGFEERLAQALERLHGHGEVFAVLFCDVDRFKRINDSLGHPAGDQVLRELARRLHAVIRPTDHVARLGGDEFAVLLHGVADQLVATQVVTRLEEALQAPFVVEGQELSIQIGRGVLLVNAEYQTLQEILRDVDLALYQAKRGGPAGTRMFEPSMREEFRGRLELEGHLRHALEREELEVHYQPIVALESSHLLGLEALLRWRHPQRGLLSAGEFVPLAEELGLIGQLDSWVIQIAQEQLYRWQVELQSFGTLWLNVNVSAAHLKQVAQLAAHLRPSALPAPWKILIEITERVLTHTAETDAATLGVLQAAGAELVVDDFGVGASSLSSLHRFPLRMLKIDRSFVASLDQNRELIRTIAVVSHTLGLTVVAEGIETEAQRTELLALGIGVGQGYLFARPLPAEKIVPLLNPAAADLD